MPRYLRLLDGAIAFGAIAVASALIPQLAFATDWQSASVPVCLRPGRQNHAAMSTDGAGGAYFAWQDLGSTPAFDLEAVHLDASGAPSGGWQVNGTLLAHTEGINEIELCRDASDGAYLAWTAKVAGVPL